MSTGANGPESATPTKGGWRRISEKAPSDTAVPVVKKSGSNP
jgi:hypothetical protein